MQQDHENQVEMLRLDHLKALNSMRQRCKDEVRPLGSFYAKTVSSVHHQVSADPGSCLFQESAQRQSLLESLQEERERLQASHAEQLDRLRLRFDEQIEQMKLEHSRKVSPACSAVPTAVVT